MTTASRSSSDAELAQPDGRSLWERVELALVLLLLIWFPQAIISQIDGLIDYLRLQELARDMSWLVLVLSMLALLLGLLSWLIARGGRLGGASSLGRVVGWIVIVFPCLFAIAVQGAYDTRHWVENLIDRNVTVAPGVKLLIAGAIPVLVVALIQLRPRRATRWVWARAREARTLAYGLFFAATGYLVIYAIAQPRRTAPSPQLVPQAASARPDIVLITLDSLSAADADPCGSGPTLMPNLRRLARDSACFSRFYATSNFTNPTTSSIETGVLPWRHWAVQIGATVLPVQRNHALGSLLQARGYRTVSISGNLLASPRYHGTYGGYSAVMVPASYSVKTTVREWFTAIPDSNLPAFIQSATSFLGTVDVLLNDRRYPWPAERVYSPGLAELANRQDGRPKFLWMHTLAPHAPYLPPAATRGVLLPGPELTHWREMKGDNLFYAPNEQPLIDKYHRRYQETVIAADMALGELLTELRRTGAYDRTVIIVSTDHGESFSHGYMGHAGPRLNEDLVRVPLVVHVPGRAPKQVTTPASQVDVMPTVLEIAGVAPPSGLDGRSLTPALAGTLAPMPVFSMSLERTSRFEPITRGQIAVVDGDWKLIHDLADHSDILFDVARDPDERRDLAIERSDVVARLSRLVQVKVAQAEVERRRNVGD